MKNELTVYHLAPYLPYSLKLQFLLNGRVEKTEIMKSINHNEYETHPTKVSIGWNDAEHIWMFKPILRPITDINKQKEQLNLSSNLQMQLDIFDLPNIVDLKVTDYQKLLSWHFDIFGLISQGLAIDINTLS